MIVYILVGEWEMDNVKLEIEVGLYKEVVS